MSVGIFNAETNETKDVADKARVAILDNELDENSNNAVKNKVIAQKIAELNQSIEELNTLLNGMDETLGGKLDVSKIANNLVTTEAGYALDARMGKALSESKLNRFECGALNLGFIPAGGSVKFTSTGLYFIMYCPSNTICVIDAYINDHRIKSLADESGNTVTVSMINNGYYMLTNNGGWGIAFTVIGSRLSLI